MESTALSRSSDSRASPIPPSLSRCRFGVVDASRNVSIHRAVQTASRRDVFRDYRLGVAKVVRDYGKLDRAQAPVDTRAAERDQRTPMTGPLSVPAFVGYVERRAPGH